MFPKKILKKFITTVKFHDGTPLHLWDFFLCKEGQMVTAIVLE